MLRIHYPALLENDLTWLKRATVLSAKTYELTGVLVGVLGTAPKNLDQPAYSHEQLSRSITYHDSCSGLRELNIKIQPRTLLKNKGVNIIEMNDRNVCCSFGCTSCVKYPDISGSMVDEKRGCISNIDTNLVLGDDPVLSVLARSATGQSTSTYTTFLAARQELSI